MCGIVGISHHKEASKMAFLGLYALQHRGEEAAGIVSYDGKDTHVIKRTGLAVDNFDRHFPQFAVAEFEARFEFE